VVGEYDDHGKPLARSYGGIVIDATGRLLLRKPVGEFDGYAWTFPKGKGSDEEGQEATALREVREETGVEAEIVGGRIPYVFRGGTSGTVYYLMRPVKDHEDYDRTETAQVVWVTPAEARTLIARSANVLGRKRDLAVLDQALKWHPHWRQDRW
jgi:8-oxo-dGTP pyrophosphatase MutT (NUDIX family)